MLCWKLGFPGFSLGSSLLLGTLLHVLCRNWGLESPQTPSSLSSLTNAPGLCLGFPSLHCGLDILPRLYTGASLGHRWPLLPDVQCLGSHHFLCLAIGLGAPRRFCACSYQAAAAWARRPGAPSFLSILASKHVPADIKSIPLTAQLFSPKYISAFMWHKLASVPSNCPFCPQLLPRPHIFQEAFLGGVRWRTHPLATPSARELMNSFSLVYSCHSGFSELPPTILHNLRGCPTLSSPGVIQHPVVAWVLQTKYGFISEHSMGFLISHLQSHHCSAWNALGVHTILLKFSSSHN